MKVNIVKMSLLIFCTLLLALLLYSCNHFNTSNWEAEKIIKNEFMDNYSCFTEIANSLLSCNDATIDISNSENLIIGNQNVNDVTYKTISIEILNNLGYDIIIKEKGGVYFYRFRQPFLGRGIMYYPDGFQSDYNPLITSYKSIKDEEWYFFVEE